MRIKLEESKSESIQRPDHDIKNIGELFDKFLNQDLKKIHQKPEKHLVHGDIFLENVMANEDGEITGLLDFGPLTVIGDHVFDVACLTYFVTVTEGIGNDTLEYLEEKTKQYYPNDLDTIHTYLINTSLLFINSKSYDPRTYAWCLNNLRTFGYL